MITHRSLQQERGEIMYLVRILMVMVLTCLELFTAIQYVWASNTIKKNVSKEKVAKAKGTKELSYWKFAIIMVLKVVTEEQLNVVQSIPALWFVDMILMNVAVVTLIVRHWFGQKRN